MKQYAFILGNHPILSIAEIVSVFPAARIICLNKAFIILETYEIRNPQKELNCLGGIVKLYEITEEKVGEDFIKPLESFFHSYQVTKKLAFAINFFGHKNNALQKECILHTKKYLRSSDISCRFVNKDFKNTTSVQSFHEKLASDGVELAFFFDKTKTYFGRLIGSQDIEQYGERDYGKPERNMKIGLMPPKLAQVMLNLTGFVSDKTIYDPFCGTGGILAESLLMGYKFYGSDLNSQAVEQARTNLEWIAKKNGIKPDFLNNIFMQDATKLDKASFPFDAIVTESYLGPVINKALTKEEALSTENHLSHIYTSFLEKLKKRITSNTPVIYIFPVFYINGAPFFLQNTLAQILELGYTASALVPEHIQEESQIFLTERNSIVYHREGQLVGREIFRFYKKG